LIFILIRVNKEFIFLISFFFSTVENSLDFFFFFFFFLIFFFFFFIFFYLNVNSTIKEDEKSHKKNKS